MLWISKNKIGINIKPTNIKLIDLPKEEIIIFREEIELDICNTEIDMNAPRRVGSPGWEKALQIDHVIPLSKGGNDTIENVKPSHGYCNITKSATIIVN